VSILVSPTEPQRLRDIGKVSSEPERHGCDFMILAGKHRIGVQRKQFPNDFVASLADGRLYTQLNMMGGMRQVLLVLEGFGKWSADGELVSNDHVSISLSQVHGVLFSLMFEYGVPSIWVRNMPATVTLLETLQHWAEKKKHSSLKRRPGPARNAWGQLGDKGFGMHVLQSFPGVGPDTAEKMLDANGGFVPLVWTMTYEEMLQVDGIGKVTAKRLQEAL
jgi:ERCC4-type nuclease